MTHHSLSCITATVDAACSKNLLRLKYALYLDKNKKAHAKYTYTQTRTRVNIIYHTLKYLLWGSLYVRPKNEIYIHTRVNSNVYAKLSTCYRCRIHDQTDMKAIVYDPSGKKKKK